MYIKKSDAIYKTISCRYIFWPDQARVHYVKSVINYLNKNNVNFACKSDNPVNVPECRPIENFWTILKQ